MRGIKVNSKTHHQPIPKKTLRIPEITRKTVSSLSFINFAHSQVTLPRMRDGSAQYGSVLSCIKESARMVSRKNVEIEITIHLSLLLAN